MIIKELKYASFSFDEDLKTFGIDGRDGRGIVINKVYAIAFARFVIRIMARNWYRKIKK